MEALNQDLEVRNGILEAKVKTASGVIQNLEAKVLLLESLSGGGYESSSSDGMQ